MGLRRRLDQLQYNANQTMFSAQEVLDFAKAILAEIEDGVKISLIKEGDATIMDFILGKVDELPIKLKIDVNE